MSRRWYRHEGRQVFVGWDRQLETYFLSFAELCKACEGTGEELNSDYFCAVCHAEGVEPGTDPSRRHLAATPDELAGELSRLGIPFPEYVRADLEQDRLANAGEIVHDYDTDPRHTGRPA